MSLHKRRASDGSQPAAKCLRTETSDSQLDQVIAMSTDLPEASEDFKIEVKLRSKSKAARNDPRLTVPQRELYQKVLLEKSNGEPPTSEHRFAASLAIRGPISPLDQDPTPDTGYTSASHTDGGNAENKSDDDQYDDYESEMNFEDDDVEYDSEDECRSEYDADFEFKWLEPIDVCAISTLKLDEERNQ